MGLTKTLMFAIIYPMLETHTDIPKTIEVNYQETGAAVIDLTHGSLPSASYDTAELIQDIHKKEQ